MKITWNVVTNCITNEPMYIAVWLESYGDIIHLKDIMIIKL